MAFALTGFQTLGVMGTPDGAAGSRRTRHTYITQDAPATVETSGYFNSLYKRLKIGDIIDIVYLGGSNRYRSYIFNAVGESSTALKRADDPDASGGGARAITATSDGLTTGLILDGDSFVEVTSGNASHIVKLPAASAATRGREILIWVVPSTNCELQTAGAGNTINNVDCSGGAVEALLTHSQFYIARQHLATGWLLQAMTALGAVATAIVPD